MTPMPLHSRRRLLALLAGGAVACAVPAPALAGRGGAGLFGSHETRRDSGGRFPKWKGALDRSFAEQREASGPCKPGAVTTCQIREWQALLDTLAPLSPTARVESVNREMNARAYVIDPINWGVADYWASPGQFFRKNGDCEDYAIAKYMSLRALSIPTEAMRVVVLHDRILNVPHAVLAVRLGSDEVILDNQTEKVVSHTVIRHYRPIFSINEENWWLHR